MKRILVLAVLLLMTAAAQAGTLKEIYLASGTSSPQTRSFKTLYGFYADSWTMTNPGGTVITVKLEGAGGRADFTVHLFPGKDFTFDAGGFPADSLVITDGTEGYSFVGFQK